jgi:L-lactate dehydrogenase
MATIGGKPLLSFPEMSHDHIHWALDQTRKDAYKIISGKGATYYGIATVVSHIVESIARDSKKIMPLSSILTGEYGLENIALSLPSILGRNGIETVIDLPFTLEEMSQLQNSANIIKSYLDKV